MQIAIVVNSFPILSESFIFSKVMALHALDHDVTVLAHSFRNDSPMFASVPKGQTPTFVKYSPVAGGKLRLPFALLNYLILRPATTLRLWYQAIALYGLNRRALKTWAMALPLVEQAYDVIHFEYSGLAVAYLNVLPLLVPTKLVVSSRGSAEKITPLANPTRASHLSKVFAQVDKVHCVSVDMQRTVERYGASPEKVFVNRPSIDPKQFQRAGPYTMKESGPYVLLSVGRLHWYKGLEFALLAISRLVEKGYSIRYDIIGSGPEEEKLRFCIDDLGLANHVRLRGRQPAPVVREALEEADIYLLPSLSEGLSNAALEAMAMELPVVSTTAGGMEEAIRDGQEGLLVPIYQSCEMAARIEELLKDGNLRRRMGQAGRLRVEEHFTLDRQVAQFVEEYTALAARSSFTPDSIGGGP